jgi:SHS2 domain-containing protein
MYEIFEHTADLGIRVRAGSLNELFADAARGLFSVMVANPTAIRAIEEVPFQLAGGDLEELLHDWLTELLYTFYARRLVLAEFNVRIDEDKTTGVSSVLKESRRVGASTHPAKLTATAQGEPIDVRRHEIDNEVKAITWHGLKVQRLPDGWQAEVIVDI